MDDNESINCIDTYGIEFEGTGPKEFKKSNYKNVLEDLIKGKI